MLDKIKRMLFTDTLKERLDEIDRRRYDHHDLSTVEMLITDREEYLNDPTNDKKSEIYKCAMEDYQLLMERAKDLKGEGVYLHQA